MKSFKSILIVKNASMDYLKTLVRHTDYGFVCQLITIDDSAIMDRKM